MLNLNVSSFSIPVLLLLIVFCYCFFASATAALLLPHSPQPPSAYARHMSSPACVWVYSSSTLLRMSSNGAATFCVCHLSAVTFNLAQPVLSFPKQCLHCRGSGGGLAWRPRWPWPRGVDADRGQGSILVKKNTKNTSSRNGILYSGKS